MVNSERNEFKAINLILIPAITDWVDKIPIAEFAGNILLSGLCPLTSDAQLVVGD